MKNLPSKEILLEGWIVTDHLLGDVILFEFQEHGEKEEGRIVFEKEDPWYSDLLPKLNSEDLKAGDYFEFAMIGFKDQGELYYTIAKRDMRGKLETKHILQEAEHAKQMQQLGMRHLWVAWILGIAAVASSFITALIR